MIKQYGMIFLILLISLLLHEHVISKNEFSIVYFYFNSNKRCLPNYLEHTLNQAYISNNNDSDIFLLANIYECTEALDENYWLWKNISKSISIIDLKTIESNTTKYWLNISSSLFEDKSNNSALWATASYRFFYLYDFMNEYNYINVIHCESDTMLYTNLQLIKKQIKSITAMGATPLSWKYSKQLFTTASTFIINNKYSLEKLLNFFITLARDHQMVNYSSLQHFTNNHTQSFWFDYLEWLRPLACCRQSRYLPDSKGVGIKPFAVNEMSMLTFFRITHFQDMKFLPILPTRKKSARGYKHQLELYELKSTSSNYNAIFDPGSYGQLIGGSPHKKKGFLDNSHIASSILQGCRVSFQCIKAAYTLLLNWNESIFVTVPTLVCDQDDYPKTTLLHTLHIHSKATDLFVSKKCDT